MNLDELVDALDCAHSSRRRDDCGDMCIRGKAGMIYAHSDGFYLYCDPGSARMWTGVKKALNFCKLTQDGDGDGFMLLNRLPTPAEAVIIRDKLVIRKRRVMTQDELDRLARTGFKRAVSG